MDKDLRAARFETIQKLMSFEGTIDEFEKVYGPVEAFAYQKADPLGGSMMILSPVTEAVHIMTPRSGGPRRNVARELPADGATPAAAPVAEDLGAKVENG